MPVFALLDPAIPNPDPKPREKVFRHHGYRTTSGGSSATRTCASFGRASGGPPTSPSAPRTPRGGNALGRQALRSVVSPGFSLYDFSNLFVADASLFHAGCNVNPQMTAMALASLATDRIIAAG
jgi:choline dehydrogenase-like flavoprotein